jgi:myo-inositol 2-dehydrogenase / D-chiro-inositol 1-dehydrogenase
MTIRLAILSGVRHARDYLAIMAGLPEFEVVAVGEDSAAPEWARADSQRIADKADVALLGIDEALAAADAALVCSEPTRHAAIAARAVRARRHVLVDKPAAVDEADLEPLLEAAALAPDLVVTSVHRLLSPDVARARCVIDAGHIGLPLSVEAEFIASGGMNDGTAVERPELVCDPALSGGGELTNFGWYPVLTLHYLTGLEIREVVAFGGALFGGPHESFGVEDSAVLSLKLEYEVPATVTIARVPAGLGHEGSSTFRILGSHGHLVVDEDGPTLEMRKTGDAASRRMTLFGSAGIAAVQGCFAEFASAIEHRTSVTLPLPDIARAVRVLAAARASLANGRCVSVTTPEV